MPNSLTGSCLCGDIRFSLKDDFSAFYFCHCRQCQQISGSSNASNLFTTPSNIQWLQGKEKLIRYDYPNRSFSKSFCAQCGSGMPLVTKSGKALLVPAGSLDQAPKSVSPTKNIFCAEKVDWFEAAVQAPSVDGFPE